MASYTKEEAARISDLKGQNPSEYLEPIDTAAERRVVRKCDLRVVPPELVLFMLSFLDR